MAPFTEIGDKAQPGASQAEKHPPAVGGIVTPLHMTRSHEAVARRLAAEGRFEELARRPTDISSSSRRKYIARSCCIERSRSRHLLAVDVSRTRCSCL